MDYYIPFRMLQLGSYTQGLTCNTAYTTQKHTTSSGKSHKSEEIPLQTTMTIEQLKAFCLSFAGANEKLSGPPSNILSFFVERKKFAYFKTSQPEQWRFSIKVSPERFLELTDQPGVKPARYMHRFHWVTIVNIQSFDEQYLKELIHWSYNKARISLPKKVQAEIENSNL